MHRNRRGVPALTSLILTALVATACSSGDDGPQTLTVYSGRSEDLVAPLIQQFQDETGIEVSVRYASSTDMAATLREEGANSPADVFFAQDPASLGAVAEAELFAALPGDLLADIPQEFSGGATWVAVSLRSRVLIYDTERLGPADLPETVDGLLDPVWGGGRIGIAPGNSSFIAFVSAMILERGEEGTLAFLEGLAANEPQIFSGNSPIVAAVNDGTVEVGLTNHYYLLGLRSDIGETRAENHFFTTAGAESLVMPAGAGVLEASQNKDAALRFIEFLLSTDAQEYFVTETFEYPAVPGLAAPEGLPAIETLAQPDLHLSALAGVLDRATQLISEAGLL
ncbi:MAG TPA: extracellular solute-binding protein [Acidimicrobiia bacterium]|nr:extracellular solute-binding protein [Acidimicrobiia bacterium]